MQQTEIWHVASASFYMDFHRSALLRTEVLMLASSTYSPSSNSVLNKDDYLFNHLTLSICFPQGFYYLVSWSKAQQLLPIYVEDAWKPNWPQLEAVWRCATLIGTTYLICAAHFSECYLCIPVMSYALYAFLTASVSTIPLFIFEWNILCVKKWLNYFRKL